MGGSALDSAETRVGRRNPPSPGPMLPSCRHRTTGAQTLPRRVAGSRSILAPYGELVYGRRFHAPRVLDVLLDR